MIEDVNARTAGAWRGRVTGALLAMLTLAAAGALVFFGSVAQVAQDSRAEAQAAPGDALTVLNNEEPGFAAVTAEAAATFAAEAEDYLSELIALRGERTVEGEDGEPEGSDDSAPEDHSPAPGGGSGPAPVSGGGQSSGGGGAPAHSHTWDVRIVVIGSHTETETVPAWDETVHHPAVYHDWQEHWSRCATCGADITADPAAHLQATGHSGWTTETVFHSDLVTEAWDEVIHHEATTREKTVNDLGVETYCTGCGTVRSVEPL